MPVNSTSSRQKLRIILEVDVEGSLQDAGRTLAQLPAIGEEFAPILGHPSRIIGAAVGDEWQAIRYAMGALIDAGGQSGPHELVASFGSALESLGIVGHEASNNIVRACTAVLDDSPTPVGFGKSNVNLTMKKALEGSVAVSSADLDSALGSLGGSGQTAAAQIMGFAAAVAPTPKEADG